MIGVLVDPLRSKVRGMSGDSYETTSDVLVGPISLSKLVISLVRSAPKHLCYLMVDETNILDEVGFALRSGTTTVDVQQRFNRYQ